MRYQPDPRSQPVRFACKASLWPSTFRIEAPHQSATTALASAALAYLSPFLAMLKRRSTPGAQRPHATQSYPMPKSNCGRQRTRLKPMIERGFCGAFQILPNFAGVSLSLATQDKFTQAATKPRSLFASFVRRCLATGIQFPGTTG